MKINLTNEEVCEIIESYVRTEMLSNIYGGKNVSATGKSYTGLDATVTVEDAPVDSGEKEA